MKLKDVIRAEKTVEDYGRWSTGNIDRASWPLTRKKLRFSADWKWRVVFLKAGNIDIRVLLRLNEALETYYAVLGTVHRDTLSVLCSHDLHTSHANWHCHAATVEIDKVFPGVWRDSDSFRRWPSYNGSCSVHFDVTEQRAMEIASELYKFTLPAQTELSL